jgi:hypothetical protein
VGIHTKTAERGFHNFACRFIRVNFTYNTLSWRLTFDMILSGHLATERVYSYHGARCRLANGMPLR